LAAFVIAIWPMMFGFPAYFATVPRIARAEHIGRYSGLLTMATALGATAFSQTNGFILNAFGPAGYRFIFLYAGVLAFVAFLLSFHPRIHHIDE
jgi:MFS family permease